MVSVIMQRAFFGKDNCLKITLNSNKECYFEFGTAKTPGEQSKQSKKWNWKPVKFNDIELGELLLVLEGKKESVNFFHNFKGEKTQVWVRKSGQRCSIKVKELSKGLNTGEQVVLQELLRFIIVRSNLKF